MQAEKRLRQSCVCGMIRLVRFFLHRVSALYQPGGYLISLSARQMALLIKGWNFWIDLLKFIAVTWLSSFAFHCTAYQCHRSVHVVICVTCVSVKIVFLAPVAVVSVVTQALFIYCVLWLLCLSVYWNQRSRFLRHGTRVQATHSNKQERSNNQVITKFQTLDVSLATSQANKVRWETTPFSLRPETSQSALTVNRCVYLYEISPSLFTVNQHLYLYEISLTSGLERSPLSCAPALSQLFSVIFYFWCCLRKFTYPFEPDPINRNKFIISTVQLQNQITLS